MTATLAKKRPDVRGNARQAVSSTIPEKEQKMTSKVDTMAQAGPASDCLSQALRSIRQAQELMHAGWMAAAALDREDHAADQDALRTVLHVAGSTLDTAYIAIERAAIERAAIGSASI